MADCIRLTWRAAFAVLILGAGLFGVSAGCAASGAMVRVGGSGTDLAAINLVGEAFMKSHPGIRVDVLPSLGSGGGVKAVAAGKLDIGLTSRPLNARERKMAVHAQRYARTALVFAVAQGSPLSSVTISQLAAIYSGERTHLHDGSVVRPILRPQSDSDTLLLRKTYPVFARALDEAYHRNGLPMAVTDQVSAENLSSVPGAIGTSTLALIMAEKRPIKPLILDGVMPSSQTLSDGTYPLVKDLYFVLGEKVSPSARAFLRYLGSPGAAAILLDTGHDVVKFDTKGF